MLTADQETWLSHLSDNDTITIIPYNPQAILIYQAIKSEIQAAIGQHVDVQHRGASSFGISGQGDVDIYIPVEEDAFDEHLAQLTQLYGQSGSCYPKERARWNKIVNGLRSEVMLMNTGHSSWLRTVTFDNYLRTHPDAQEEYRILKEEADGKSTREYYRRKIVFINSILEKAGQIAQLESSK